MEITKSQAKAYAAISLDFLRKVKIKVSPYALEEQMEMMYALYEPDEAEKLYSFFKENNKTITSKLKGKARCYIVNNFDSKGKQLNIIKRFCKNRITIEKMYITTPGENRDIYYELIKDIRDKSMDILMVNIFTILGMSERKLAIIKRLCRENNITYLEV